MFTLIELLVVVAIISVLASFLLPALQKSKQRLIITTCANSQKQTFLAIAMYGSDNQEYPATGRREAYYLVPSIPTVTGDAKILERWGFGLGPFTTQGPYQMLVEDGYVDGYLTLQCTSRPFALTNRRNGWQQKGSPSTPGSMETWGQGTWFGYNGPNVWGPTVGNNGANNGLLLLGGHHINEANSWGLSMKDGGSHKAHNSYRSGATGVENIALLGCPGLVEAAEENTWSPVAQREPHLDAPANIADDYGNPAAFQTDGPNWTNPYRWRVSRNYTFGDGHVSFIYRTNRAYTTADSF